VQPSQISGRPRVTSQLGIPDIVDFHTVLDNARQLSTMDQTRLIDALWNLVPDDVELPLHPEWAAELQRRVTERQSGTAKSISWAQVRSEALARVRDDNAH